MPVPKRKVSKSRRDKRHANKGIKVKSFTFCVQCAEPLLPHQVCTVCGFYKGEKVLATKLDRMVKRREERQAIAQRRAQRAQPTETGTPSDEQEKS